MRPAANPAMRARSSWLRRLPVRSFADLDDGAGQRRAHPIRQHQDPVSRIDLPGHDQVLKRGDLIPDAEMADPAAEFEHSLAGVNAERIQDLLDVADAAAVHMQDVPDVVRLYLR